MNPIQSKSGKSPSAGQTTPARTKAGQALKIRLLKGTLKLKTLEKTIRIQEAKGYQLINLNKSKSGGLVNKVVFQKLAAKAEPQKLNLDCTHAPAGAVVMLSKPLFVEGGIQTVKGWRVKMASKGDLPV